MRSPITMMLGFVLIAVVAAARRTVRHVIVTGPSMLPTAAPGDRLVLLRIPGRPRVGELVIAGDPRARHRTLLKRVHAVSADAIAVRGDNPAASTDSRTFGLLPITAVERCIAWRYAPAGRVALVSWWRAPAGRARSRPPGRR